MTKKLTKHNLYFRMVKVPEVPLIFTNIPHPFNSLGNFFKAPHKVTHVCGFSPSTRTITLNAVSFCSSKSHKCNNYDKATYIVSSNLCLLTYPQSRPQAFHEIAIHRAIILQWVFLKSIPLFLVLTCQIVYHYPRS